MHHLVRLTNLAVADDRVFKLEDHPVFGGITVAVLVVAVVWLIKRKSS